MPASLRIEAKQASYAVRQVNFSPLCLISRREDSVILEPDLCVFIFVYHPNFVAKGKILQFGRGV
jgi:hypothetical protein